MINFQKQIMAELKKRKISPNKAARDSGIDTPRIYAIREGKPVTTPILEKILNFLGAELIFKKGRR